MNTCDSMAVLLTVFFLCLTYDAESQDPLRFEAQVAEIVDQKVGPEHPLFLFTGSSSIRMWKDLANRYPEHHVFNTGFGGSQFSDLIYYSDELILRHNPSTVFIYEGDNDIADGKSHKQIGKDAKRLIKIIHKHDRLIQIVLISPKPSLARWHLKDQYDLTNEKLSEIARRRSFVKFADVWNPMLDESGHVFKDIFIEDGLHMNSKGYDIWSNVLRPFLQ
ncbi:MAG: GDSL-type esterase/lipase family protein [Saprospiraceae bacterium]|nr:GDSL-type esterase/lipase family protein [Saprospiraceae bacterium]